jgi:Helix-turn-helix domain
MSQKPLSKDLIRRRWYRHLLIPRGPKLVLSILMAHSDEKEYSFPSLATLSTESRLKSEAVVSRYIAYLVKAGIVTRGKRPNKHGHWGVNSYVVNVGTIPEEKQAATPHKKQAATPQGLQTKVFHSEGFTSEGSQSSQKDGPLPTVVTEKTKTDPVNSEIENLEIENSKIQIQNSEKSYSEYFAAALAAGDAKWKARLNAPMPVDPWSVDKVYLRKACDALREAAPGVELKTPLPGAIFKPLAALYDDLGIDQGLVELGARLAVYAAELKSATAVAQLELVLAGKSPIIPYENGLLPVFILNHPQYETARSAFFLLQSEAEELAWWAQYLPDQKPFLAS